MVKIGPKLPSPSRRELEKIEKEQKRLEQLQSGFKPTPAGEPRENLRYLLSASKRLRFKHPNMIVVVESKRKREKAQKRALAKRNAKGVMKDLIARITPGSKAHGGVEENLPAGAGISTHDLMTPTVRAVELLTITESPALLASSGNTSDYADFSTASESRYLATNLPDSALVDSVKAIQEDKPWGLTSPIELAMEHPDSGKSSEISGTDGDVSSTPRLEIQISTETDTFWEEAIFTSVTAPAATVNPQITEDIEVINYSMKTSPERQQMALTSQILPPMPVRRSSSRGSQLLDHAAGSTPQTPLSPSPSSDFEISSEPLDYSGVSSKASPTHSSEPPQNSSRKRRRFYNTRRRGEPRMEGLDRPDTPIPHDYEGLWSSTSGSRLPPQSNIRLASGTSSDVPMAPRAAPGCDSESYYPHGWPACDSLTKTPGTSEKPCCIGLSADDVAREVPRAIPQWFVPTTPVSSPVIEGVSTPHPASNSPVDSILLAIVGNKYPDMSQLGSIGLAVPSCANFTKTSFEESLSLAQLKPNGSGQAPTAKNLTIPNHSIAQSASFSSNISSPCGSDKISSALPIGAAIFQDAPHYLGAYVPSSNETIRPLAPAPIIQENKTCSGILTKMNLNIPRTVTFDELETGTLDAYPSPRMSGAVTGGTISSGQSKAFQQDAVYRQDILTYPDTPLGERSGIIPPTSTPVSRSPNVFSIALPTAPWSRAPVLPTHEPHMAKRSTEEGGVKGFMLALKWALKRTFEYFWQRRR